MAASVSSLSAVAFSVVTVSIAAGLLPLDYPSTVTCGTPGSTGVGPPTADPVLWIDFSHLCSGASSSDDTSSSLATTWTAFPLPLLGAMGVSPPPWPPAVSILEICTPRDSSPLCCTVTPMSSSVGSSLNNRVHVGWFDHTRAQPDGWGGGLRSWRRMGWGSTSPTKQIARLGSKLSHDCAQATWCQPLCCTAMPNECTSRGARYVSIGSRISPSLTSSHDQPGA
jgi:hypothetical protein